MNRYVIFLRGHYLNLATAELFACLEANKVNYKVINHENQLLVIETNDELKSRTIKKAIKRCSLTHCVIKLNYISYIENDDKINIKEVLPLELDSKYSYRVRVTRYGDKYTSFSTYEFERKLAEYIWKQQSNDIRVDLDNPDKEIRGILHKNTLYCGLLEWSIDLKRYAKREPGKRPFFRPGSMKTDFARALINLCQLSKGEVLYDPFSGSGGILLEAIALGMHSFGSDLDYRAVRGAKKNIDYYFYSGAALFIADSRFTPLKKVDGIATDPPYSIQSSTHGEQVNTLLTDFLKEMKKILKKNKILVMCAPKRNHPEKLAESLNWTVKTVIDERLHRSLTRRVLVLVNN